jgi:hypothetical protein
MKKVLLLLALVIVSCSKEEEQTPALNCDCDKVVAKTTYNVIGTPQNPTITYYTTYTTINECSNVQKQKTFSTTDASLIPEIGECR